MHLEIICLSLLEFILEESLVSILGGESSFEDDKTMEGMVIDLVEIEGEKAEKASRR